MKKMTGYERIPKITVSYNGHATTQEKMNSSTDAYELFLSVWNKNTLDLFEEFKVLFINRNGRVLGYRNISRGSSAFTVVNRKLIFTISLLCNAHGIVLCHNHPSGNITPSPQDRVLTKNIKAGCRLLELDLLDHLIITPHSYFSFADDGILASM